MAIDGIPIGKNEQSASTVTETVARICLWILCRVAVDIKSL